MNPSQQRADNFKREFLALRARMLAAVAGDLKTKREAFATLRRKYQAQLEVYLRVPGTTYGDWLQHGPFPYYDEVVAAVEVDAVWDRLVERCAAPEGEHHGP